MHFGERARTPGRRLGVKGSQVQILSARQRETAAQGPYPERSGTAPDRFPRRFDHHFDHHLVTLSWSVTCRSWRRMSTSTGMGTGAPRHGERPSPLVRWLVGYRSKASPSVVMAWRATSGDTWP